MLRNRLKDQLKLYQLSKDMLEGKNLKEITITNYKIDSSVCYFGRNYNQDFRHLQDRKKGNFKKTENQDYK